MCKASAKRMFILKVVKREDIQEVSHMGHVLKVITEKVQLSVG
jgi:hypothetical protein